jgi:hypothetical protein
MNRTQHRAKAEHLLEEAHTTHDQISRSLIPAEAQVHATLALSAPPGASPPSRGQPEARYATPDWRHDQGSSEGSAGSEPQPDAPGSRYAPGKHPLLQPRAGETRDSGPAAPQSAPPEPPDTRPPPLFEPGPGGPGKKEPGDLDDQKPRGPEEQKPGGFRPLQPATGDVTCPLAGLPHGRPSSYVRSCTTAPDPYVRAGTPAECRKPTPTTSGSTASVRRAA